MIDDHEDDVVGYKVAGFITANLSASGLCNGRPDDEVDDGFQDAEEHPDGHGGPVLELFGQGGFEGGPVDVEKCGHRSML